MEFEAPERPRRAGCFGYLLFVSAASWVVTVTLAAQQGAWLVGQVLLIEGEPMPSSAWALVSWVNGLLLLLPLVPLAILTAVPWLRAVYQTWALAAAFMVALGFVRLLPEMRTQAAAAVQLLVALACLGALTLLARGRGYRPDEGRGAAVPALVLAPLVIWPWLAFGALGSPLDALLGLLAGFGLGLLAALLLDAFLVVPLRVHSAGVGRDTLFGGLAAAVALLVLGGGFGFAGSQLLLMVALPPLGFAVVALGRAGGFGADGGWISMAALAGLAAAGPLMFFDPNELTLVLDPSDVPHWATLAAGMSALGALAVGFALGIWRNRLAQLWRTGSSAPVLAAWALALAVYLVAGQPGFHGDWLFVVLRDQADVSRARTVADRGERVRYVYDALARHASGSQAGLRADLDRLGIQYRPYYLVNALEVNGGPLVRLYLSRRPEVDRVLDSPRLRPLPEPVRPGEADAAGPADPGWNVTAIGADRVWRELGVTGAGIVVGQSDSGVEGGHPALRDGYRGRDGGDDYNWLDPWYGTRSPVDRSGHGTHTLGSAVGRGGVGVAPGAEWFACVNLPRNLANPAYYLDCLQFVLAPYPRDGDPFVDGDPLRAAHVANNSWGCPPYEGCEAATLAPATRALRAAGIFVVTAAGNTGPRCGSVSDPIAIYPDAFTVGAVDQGGDVAVFSSRGPVTVDGSGRIKPDLLAPGVEVLSSYPGGYRRESGTSSAGPHVAGVVALMWSAQPRLIGDVETTERILIETARPYDGVREGCFLGDTPNAAYGYGVVDAYAAVKAALELGR